MIIVPVTRRTKKNFPLPLLMLLLDPGFGNRGPGSGMDENKDPRFGIHIPDPQHWNNFFSQTNIKVAIRAMGQTQYLSVCAWCGGWTLPVRDSGRCPKPLAAGWRRPGGEPGTRTPGCSQSWRTCAKLSIKIKRGQGCGIQAVTHEDVVNPGRHVQN